MVPFQTIVLMLGTLFMLIGLVIYMMGQNKQKTYQALCFASGAVFSNGLLLTLMYWYYS